MSTSTHALPKNIAALLVRRGLPVDYAERAAAEFEDHHGDLANELSESSGDENEIVAEATRLLGDCRTLIKKTVREYQRRSWCGRWPLTTFLIGPIPLLLAAWTATILVAGGAVWLLHQAGFVGDFHEDGIVSAQEWWLDRAVAVWFLLAVPAIVVLILARLARRAALGWPWIATAAMVLALFVGLIKTGFPDPTLQPRRHDGGAVAADARLLTVGVPLLAPSATNASALVDAMWNWYMRDPQQAGQSLLPILVAAGVGLRAAQLSRQASARVLAEC
jgi:hypothetical protein